MASKKNEDLLRLKKQLKDGALSPLYVLYGEEEYLREMYAGRIMEKVPDGGFPEFNHIKLEGKDVSFSEYDDAWESFPMMADKKLIYIKNSEIFTSKRSASGGPSTEEKKEFWSEKFKRIADDTVVVFDEMTVDKRSALYKAAAKAGTVVEFAYQSDADLVTWIIGRCLKAKKKISKENAYYLVTLCDPGLGNINNELGKLLDFCGEEIYKTDIDRVVSKSIQVVVFELTDAIMSGNTAKAVSTLADLKTAREGAFNLMYLMLASFDKMLLAKLMDGSPQNEIASEIGVSPYIVRKYIDGARGFTADALTWMVRRVAELDLAVKEGRVDEWTALEQYVMECIHMNSR